MKLEKTSYPVLISLFRADRHRAHPDGFDKRGVTVDIVSETAESADYYSARPRETDWHRA